MLIAICLFSTVAASVSCRKTSDREYQSLNQAEAGAVQSVFFKLKMCQEHLCVRSIIKEPGQVNPALLLKMFDELEIQSCVLDDVPKISTADCKTIQKFAAPTAPVAQLSLVDVEQNYLKQENSLLLDEAVHYMSLFSEEAAMCEASGFLDSHYGPKATEIILQYKDQYDATLTRPVTFFHAFLGEETKKESDSGGLSLLADGEVDHGARIKDRIIPRQRYTLDVLKFEPKVTLGIDVAWPDIANFSVSNFADVQDTVKHLVEAGKADNQTLRKLRDTTISGLEIVNDLWDRYPLHAAFHHVGVSFSPKGITSGIDQALETAQATGNFARVEHPTIDPIKYAWQIFHGHTIGHLGTAAVAIGDIRKFSNAGFGVYTSLAFVVRELGPDGKPGAIVDSFVYPYRAQDHGLLSIDELKALYKGNFISLEKSSAPFIGQNYIDFLERHVDVHLDEVAQSQRLRDNHVSKVNQLVDYLTPLAGLDEDPEKLKGQIKNRVYSYIEALDYVKDLNVEDKANIKKSVELELKRDILRIAIEELGFESSEYRRIIQDSIVDGNIFEAKDLASLSETELSRVFNDFATAQLIPETDKLISDQEYARLRSTKIYKLQDRFAKFDFAEFADSFPLDADFDQDIFKAKLFEGTNFGRGADRVLSEHIFPLINGYRGLQDLDLDQKLEFKESLKVQMKYDFLRFAVTEYGYENPKLKEISDQRKFSILAIFSKENKNLLTKENIDAIYDDFINDKELGRFKSPTGDAEFHDWVKANGGNLKFQNPQLYRYQSHLKKNLDFENLLIDIEALHASKEFSDRFTEDLVRKIGPKTCETACQLLEIAGYDYDADKISTINRERSLFSDLQKQSKAGRGQQTEYAKKHSSFDIDLLPSRTILSDSQELFSSSSFGSDRSDLPKRPITRRKPPPVPGRIKIRLSDTDNCKNFAYVETILHLESIFLKLRENALYIDFLKL